MIWSTWCHDKTKYLIHMGNTLINQTQVLRTDRASGKGMGEFILRNFLPKVFKQHFITSLVI